MANFEAVDRIEPALLGDLPGRVSDVVTELAAEAAVLGRSLHPKTAANLADVVRILNTYYSNLIEGHNTKPREIERALAGQFDDDEAQRNLQVEAAAHVRVQSLIDRQAADGSLPEAATRDFIVWTHAEFYKDASDAMLQVRGKDRTLRMLPGEWRSLPEHDNVVGRHIPPSSRRVDDFMRHFSNRYRMASLGAAGRIAAVPAAHHRFNYIHPFMDGNGRVSRLMSHAMCLKAGIGAHGLWSISRGLARGSKPGPEGRAEYKQMMSHADAPRQGDLDGRGNLSEKALVDFSVWFLDVCLDQVRFMAGMFELASLAERLTELVRQSDDLPEEAARLLTEVLVRGEVERGEAPRITGLPERSARRVLNRTIAAGLLASETPKGPISLRFPASTLDVLFPRLF